MRYHNQNVIALEHKEGEPQMYQYDVTEYKKAEYDELQALRSRSDIDYIAIVTGVDLDV